LIPREDKIKAITLIEEACNAGSRREKACEMLGLDIRTLQRWQGENSPEDKRQGSHLSPANKLTDAERAQILGVANSPEYCNQAPSQIVPSLADHNTYIASESTFYRVLKAAKQLKHRSASAPKTHHKPDELVATKPNQVWSWDISYLPTIVRGIFFYLYFFLDIFSRKIVGFEVFETESAEHAAEVVAKAYQTEDLKPGDITLHSDNGKPMKGITMLAMLETLGVMPSFSRPSVSDDNPFSEALFKTTKYCPFYPSKPFSFPEEARAWVYKFVGWYNNEHHHSGIQFVTPNARHQGLDKTLLENRVEVYERARQRHPNRWSGSTRNWRRVEAVILNPKQTHRKTA